MKEQLLGLSAKPTPVAVVQAASNDSSNNAVAAPDQEEEEEEEVKHAPEPLQKEFSGANGVEDS